MADLIIDDDLLQRLREIAQKENRPVEDVLRAMVKQYALQPDNSDQLQVMLEAYHTRAAETDPLEALLGMFDDDITDLSSMTKEDVLEVYRKKYGDSH